MHLQNVGGHDAKCFTNLGHPERLGLLLLAICSLLSTTSILVLFILFTRNVISAIRVRGNSQEKMFRSHIDAYFLSLLMGDILQGIGGIMSLKWVKLSASRCGSFCDAQGALQQLGEQAVSISTMWIAIITFSVIFFQWSPRPGTFLATILISLSWLFMFLNVIIGWATHRGTDNDGDRYYTPTPYWCYLGDDFRAERIATGYFWIWLAAFVSIILYSLLFLRIRGNILIAPAEFPRIRMVVRRSSSHALGQRMNVDDADRPDPMKDALKMLAYPICYVILVMPLSIVRWITFTGGNPPFAATAATICIFKLSGLANVFLFMLTRPGLLLFNRKQRMDAQSRLGPLSGNSDPIELNVIRSPFDPDPENPDEIVNGTAAPPQEGSQAQTPKYGIPPPSPLPVPPSGSLSSLDLSLGIRSPSPTHELRVSGSQDPLRQSTSMSSTQPTSRISHDTSAEGKRRSSNTAQTANEPDPDILSDIEVLEQTLDPSGHGIDLSWYTDTSLLDYRPDSGRRRKSFIEM